MSPPNSLKNGLELDLSFFVPLLDNIISFLLELIVDHHVLSVLCHESCPSSAHNIDLINASFNQSVYGDV